MFIASDYEKYYSVKANDVVFDMGAFNGRHTLLFSRAVGPKGKVVSLEPSHASYIKLLNAISEYRLSNVVALNVGVFNVSGSADLKVTDDFGGAATTFVTDVRVKETQLTPVLTLDQITEFLKIEKINFLKSDIEGAEIEALQGAQKTLGIVDNLAIGSYHIRDNETTAARVEALLQPHGFKIVTEPGDTEQGYTDEIVTYGTRP